MELAYEAAGGAGRVCGWAVVEYEGTRFLFPADAPVARPAAHPVAPAAPTGRGVAYRTREDFGSDRDYAAYLRGQLQPWAARSFPCKPLYFI